MSDGSGQDDLTTDQTTELGRLLDRFEEAWERGERPVIDQYLPADVPWKRGALIELIHVDLERRIKAGEAIRVESYLQGYPQLATDSKQLMELIVKEHRLRRRREPVVKVAEYQQRFPQLGAALVERLARETDKEAGATREMLAPDSSARADWPRLPGYEILDELGRGGMGIVYKARLASRDCLVALKMVRKERLAHPESGRRFRREVQAITRLSHPHVVTVYDSDQAGDAAFIAMEYVEGVNFQSLVERDGPLPVHRACDCIRQAALGLQHAFERGLVHRDIKPGNLMLAQGPDPRAPGLVKVLDMGLARLLQTEEEEPGFSTMTRDGMVIGTLDYIAPEQAQNAHTADIRADLYSLGCTFYFLLTGQVPFPGGTPLEKLDKHRWSTPRLVSRLRSDVPAEVASLVRKLMAKRPEDRYQVPAEVAVELEPFCLANRPAPARPSPPPGRVTQKVPMPSPESLEQHRVQHEVDRLRHLLADQLERNNLKAARLTLRELFRLNPQDPEALSVQAMLERPAAPGESLGECMRLPGHTDWVWSVALSPDGARALSAGRDQTLRLWDLAGGKELCRFPGHTDMVRCVTFSADGKRALSGSGDRTVRLWDVDRGKELRRFTGHKDVVKCVALAPAGDLALSGGGDRTVRLWDVERGQRVRTFRGHEGDVNSVAFTRDGSCALSGSWDKTVRWWEVATGKEMQRQGGWLTGYQWSVVMSMALSPDGKQLLTGSSDNALHLWDVTTGRPLARWEGHTNWVASVAFSPDGRHAISGSWDHTVRLWEVAGGSELGCFTGHTDQVHSVAFAPDGVHALSGSADRTVRWWRVLAQA